MKKLVKMTLALFAFTALAGAFQGCIRRPGDDTLIDPNKTQVYVSVFNGGFGKDWLDELAKRFNNKEENQATQLIVMGNKDTFGAIRSSIEGGVSQADIFFTTDAGVLSLGIPGHSDNGESKYLEDLSDVWDMKVDGTDVSIRGKMKVPELFLNAYGYQDKIYGVPWTEGLQGFIYDHDFFIEEGFLIKSGGSLTVGKDGKAGTYDDGLPVNMAEWNEMLGNIVRAGYYPFSWAGGATDYLISLGETVFAQYEGLDNYAVANTFKGTYENPVTGDKTVITPAEGYKTYELMEGRKLAAQFVRDNLVSNDSYFTPNSKKVSTTFKNAQDLFITGYKNASSNPRAGMIYEGIWWENESRATFMADKTAGMGYGQRDFRLMPLPAFTNQKGANGDGTGSVIGVSENGTVIVKKLSDPVKRKAAKDFVAFTCSDEALRLFTTATGTPRPYEYSLSDAEYNSLSKFCKNVWTLYTDDNIKLARYQLALASSPMFTMASPPASRWQSKPNSKFYNFLYDAMNDGVTPDAYFTGLQEYMNESKWETSYDMVKSYYEG